MDVFNRDRDSTNEAKAASSQLEKLSKDVAPLVRPVVTRKRCYSVVIAPENANKKVASPPLPPQPSPQPVLIMAAPRQKIPRPPNAFMLFANEWRKKLAVQFPRESNKDISVRLGAMWKAMLKDDKDKYFMLAREVDAEHKRKYPDYVYNPKEARMRKALREQSRESRNQLTRCHAAVARPQHHQAFPGRPPHGRQSLMSPRMLAEQHRNLEETKKAIREQVEQGMIQGYAETYLDIEAIPYHQLANHMSLPGGGDYAVIAEIDGQQWLPYMQAPQPGATYMTRNEDAKLQQGGGHWNQYSAEARTQQVPPYPVRQQMMNGSYGGCLPSQALPEASSMMGRSGDNTDMQPSQQQQQQQYVYEQQQQQPPAGTTTLTPNMVPKEEVNREERLHVLELIPTSTTSSEPATSAAAASTTVTPKTETPASGSAAPSTSKSGKGDSQSASGPLPAFEQAFGSTEIGRYSHEGFFNNSQQSENQQQPQQQQPPQQPVSNQNPSTSSHPEEVPDPANPTLDFAPSNKVPGEDGFFSATWPPFYLFPPGDTKLIPPADMGRSGLYLGSPPSYAAYFDYALAEFVPGNADPEAVLVAASNAYRDTEAGLDYVTLHIPPNAEDQGSSVSKVDPLDVATKPEGKEKSDDLEHQDLPITGVALREPIVISQNERICVLMDTPSPAGDAREFTSL
ncbi:uncharacterized protein [Periplaneta americana]|uniref:uncharacterized protein isoform X2 n=1 Tax=Periplaneta americana TaxID=6978 RepID=UPI0037E9B788